MSGILSRGAYIQVDTQYIFTKLNFRLFDKSSLEGNTGKKISGGCHNEIENILFYTKGIRYANIHNYLSVLFWRICSHTLNELRIFWLPKICKISLHCVAPVRQSAHFWMYVFVWYLNLPFWSFEASFLYFISLSLCSDIQCLTTISKLLVFSSQNNVYSA